MGGYELKFSVGIYTNFSISVSGERQKIYAMNFIDRVDVKAEVKLEIS